jgi:hypothetical protein
MAVDLATDRNGAVGGFARKRRCHRGVFPRTPKRSRYRSVQIGSISVENDEARVRVSPRVHSPKGVSTGITYRYRTEIVAARRLSMDTTLAIGTTTTHSRILDLTTPAV